MAKPVPKKKHLRLYTEQTPKPASSPIESVACLPELAQAFQATTGWQLQYNGKASAQVEDGRRLVAVAASGPTSAAAVIGSGLDSRCQSQISDPEAGASAVQRDAVGNLAGMIGQLLGELLETREVLWKREAELAAGVPVVPQREAEKHLAERLQAVLQASVDAVDADAAALYLLDEATTKLKLRSSCGLPFERLIAPARPLAGALADLEAMLGHVVVIDRDDSADVWNMPEHFPAAVCLPVSTPTMLLGTLWVFDNTKRDFSDKQTNILEVVAGRLASDLEREMLLRTAMDGAKLQQQIGAAERRQRNELPTIAPMLDGWDMAGATTQAGDLGGALHDWSSLPDGLLAVSIGRAMDEGISGALTASALKTALRAHCRYHHEPETILQQLNLTLWTGSAGDRRASLLLGLVETATGLVRWSWAGGPSVVRLTGDGWQSLSRTAVGLGEGPEAQFEADDCLLLPGEALVIFTDTVRDATDSEGRVFGEAGLATALQSHLDLSANELLGMAQATFRKHLAVPPAWDHSILVIKRD